jgi:DNA excision repair protein ERCC-5
MPGHLQKDMIQRILRDHRQQARETFIPLAGNPEEYSRAQINSFLKTSKLNRRIEKAKRKLAGVNEEQGKRVASEADRMFILSNEKERRKHKGFLGGRYCPSSSEEDEEKEETKNKDIDDIFKDGGGKSLSQEECDSTAINTVTGESVRTPLLDRWRQKRQLVDDSAVSSIKDFTRRLETSGQQLKISYHTSYNANNSNANTSAASPMLAIERARRRRLELEIATTSQVRNEDQKDTIEISFQASDAIEDSSYQHLFPASMFDQKKNVKQEQVTPKKEEVVEVEEEDEDIEWEPAEVVVKESETTMMNFSSVEQEEETKAKPAIEVIQIDQEEKEEDDVKWEEAQAKEEEEFQPKFEEKKELIELEDEEDEEETYDNDDMYLMNLKNELEEEKAEEDLKLLKEEALQSAIATASNLTQWAAGAVRKALEAHTQKATTATSISNTATASSSEINQVVLEVQDSPERDERKVVEEKYPVSLSKGVSDLIQVAENEEETDEYLEAMIARSLEDSISPSTSTLHAPRYLHYTTATATAASTSKSSALLEDDQVSEENVAMLEQERELLKKTKQRQMRDVEGFTDEMVQEVMALLRLFGVPFLVCPMEAEAQCAALEQLGLVDGIITDDSDIFAFGGQHVYKNIFHHQKFVEAFYAQDIEKELGFTQQEMVRLCTN